MRLDRLGWTQEEVAQVVGVTHQRITQILQEIAELPKLAKNVLASGIPHLEVAERFNLPLQVVWAIDLAGRDDAERLDRLGWTQEEVAAVTGVAQQRVTQITNNVTPDKISNLLSEGRDMTVIQSDNSHAHL